VKAKYMKGKITTNITKSEFIFIDPQTGEKLTQEEFNRRHKKTGGFNLGGLRGKVPKKV
jgi:hypothetical protein